jgi:hypothetical protein
MYKKESIILSATSRKTHSRRNETLDHFLTSDDFMFSQCWELQLRIWD